MKYRETLRIKNKKLACRELRIIWLCSRDQTDKADLSTP